MINPIDQPLLASPPPNDSGWGRYTPLLSGGAAAGLCLLGLQTFFPNIPIIESVALGALAFGVGSRLTAPSCLPPSRIEVPIVETRPPEVVPPSIQPVVAPTPSIVSLIRKVIEAKEKNMQDCRDEVWGPSNIALICGDLFSFLYFGLLAVQHFMISTQQTPFMIIATPICGIVGGSINVAVSLVSLKEGIQALNNGDYKLASRLLPEFALYFVIGTIMILASVVSISALGLASTAVFAGIAANPWILPFLFFIASLVAIYEPGCKLLNVIMAKNLGSQLKLGALEPLLQNKQWDKIKELYLNTGTPFDLSSLEGVAKPAEIISKLSVKMEELQADMGVEAGLEVFRLFEMILNKEDKQALAQIQEVNKKIKKKTESLCLRIFQQVIYIIGFVISMIVLGVNLEALKGAQNVLLFVANVIPAYMDMFWLFLRNTTMVVPKMTEDQLAASLGTAPQAIYA